MSVKLTPAGKVVETFRPRIVCLCGSTRFKDLFVEKNLEFTLRGWIVLTIGCDTKMDSELESVFVNFAKENGCTLGDVKHKLDALHMCKIDIADEVYVINKGGYVGESTSREIEYARLKGKRIVYME